MNKKKTPEQNAENKDQTAGSQQETAAPNTDAPDKKDRKEDTGKAPEDQNGEKKELTEQEVMKLYLEQLANELKKSREQNETLKKQAEEFESEALQYKQKLSSLSAEYENYRRRTASEKEGILSEAVAKAVLALLPALDSLQKAVEFAQSNPEGYEQGVEMTLRQLSEGFSKLGVEEIEAAGAVFNPDLHNAVMHVQDEGLGESIVTDVFQRGYRIGDRVIRHSMVKVAN